MKRFNEDDDFNEDLFPDVDGDGDEMEELNAEYIKVLEKRELIEALKVQIVQKEINYTILDRTVQYLEKTWFWRFKSTQSRLNLIVETYQTFKALVDIDTQYHEEEEQKPQE